MTSSRQRRLRMREVEAGLVSDTLRGRIWGGSEVRRRCLELLTGGIMVVDDQDLERRWSPLPENAGLAKKGKRVLPRPQPAHGHNPS